VVIALLPDLATSTNNACKIEELNKIKQVGER